MLSFYLPELSFIHCSQSCHFVPLAMSFYLPAYLHGWEMQDLSAGPEPGLLLLLGSVLLNLL